MKTLRAFSLSLLALCSSVCVAGAWVASAPGSAREVIQRLEHAHWIDSGAKSPERVVYVFADPDCPYCNDLWNAIGPARAPNVAIRYLLVAVIDADSRGKAAAILESKNPAAAFEKHERNFARGGLAPLAKLQPSTAETIFTNEALMSALHLYGTPGLVYMDEHNELKVFAGMPDAGQLRKIVGKR